MGLFIFLIFIAFTQLVIGKELPDLTFIIRNISNKIEPVCIFDKNVLDSTLGWVYPIPDTKDKLPSIVSNYIPDLNNDYSCDFLKTKHCSSLWQMEDWQFSKIDSHKFKPTLDSRWEEFPILLTSNAMKEFKNRIDIPHPFEMGISVRSVGPVEVFICTGFDPYTYPCYYINIGGLDKEQAFLRKYKKIPESIGFNDTKLVKYMSDDKVLSENEWCNFIIRVSDNGTLSLMEMFNNVTLLNYEDDKMLQPIYSLFIRSRDSKSLWKIHNSHYIFTNATKLTQMGPNFAIYGDTLCVNLYVSMCRFCRMSFYVMLKGEKQKILTVFNENTNDDLLWKKIRLLQHDILEDKIKLFVETKYINSTEVHDAFWGIDDIRVCSEDEIKISRLVSNIDWQESDLQHISCQLLDVGAWRPLQNNFKSVKDEIAYSSTSTTIKISRKPQLTDEHQILPHYIIQYEGKDLCSQPETFIKSKSRIKSQGFVIARSSETLIKGLVPYTSYNISFWNVIDCIKYFREESTLPTDTPQDLELPKNVTIQATATTCEIVWNMPKCNETFGPIIYQVKVYIKNGTLSSTQTDVTTQYAFKQLQPDVTYEVEIRTARKLDNLKSSISLVYNFTTYALAPSAVKNLEVYSTSKDSAQIRFHLPKNLQEKPNSVQIRWCYPFENCNTNTTELNECKLWKQKICLDVHNLTAGLSYTFYVLLKNKEVFLKGGEANVTAIITDKVPGAPSNLTYKMRNCINTVDCCHLNISWAHPFNQSGLITMFDIVLTESSYTYVLDSYKSIHEVFKLTEESYQPVYNYNVKYISCNVPYQVSVRAVNDFYKGPFVSISLAVSSNENYVDQMPKYVNSTNETVVFKLPKIESNLNGGSLIIVAQDYNKTLTKISKEINNLEIFNGINELCNQFGETWVAKSIEMNEKVLPLLVIGDGTSSYIHQLNKTVVNRSLKPDTEYCFTFTIIKKFQESEHVIVYHDKNLFTEANYVAPQFQDDKSGTPGVATFLLPVLFLALLIACAAWLSYRYFKKRRYTTSGEHIYESMPFDDYLTDAVSNDSYDRLNRD